jgi:hypothetical protein
LLVLFFVCIIPFCCFIFVLFYNLKAGIEKARLKLSYEPEAASIWCQTISTDIQETWSKAGRQYMVIDLGG